MEHRRPASPSVEEWVEHFRENQRLAISGAARWLTYGSESLEYANLPEEWRVFLREVQVWRARVLGTAWGKMPQEVNSFFWEEVSTAYAAGFVTDTEVGQAFTKVYWRYREAFEGKTYAFASDVVDALRAAHGHEGWVRDAEVAMRAAQDAFRFVAYAGVPHEPLTLLKLAKPRRSVKVDAQDVAAAALDLCSGPQGDRYIFRRPRRNAFISNALANDLATQFGVSTRQIQALLRKQGFRMPIEQRAGLGRKSMK